MAEEHYYTGASIIIEPPLKEIENLDEKIFAKALPRALEAATLFVKRRVRFYTPFRTGALQAGWSEITQEGTGTEATVSFENLVPYGPIIEFGLYPPEWIKPGGLLMMGPSGGVYTRKKFKNPGGMLTPILINEYEAIKKTSMTALNRLLKQAAQMG